MRAAVYTRISVDHEGQEDSTDRQEAACRAFCDMKGWDVAEVFTDRGISGWSGVDRPGWRALERAVEAGEVEAVVVYAISRAARNTRRLLEFAEMCDARGAALESTSEPIGGTYGRVFLTILGALAELESQTRSTRVRSKVEQMRADGRWLGGARPFGFRVKAGRLVPDKREGNLIREAVRHILAGGKWLSVARGWNEEGIKTPQGNKWTGQKVRGVLEHERHVGTTLTRRDHKRIVAKVEAATYDRKGYNRSSRYMLTGLLVCSVCGARMVGRPEHGRRRYVCKATGRVHLSVPADVVEDVVTRRAADAEIEAEDVVDPATLSAPLLAAIDDVETRIEAFAREAAAAGMSAAEIRAGREPLIAERDRLQRELDAVPVPREGLGFAYLLEDVEDPTPVEWRAMVETVVDHVEIGPGTADGVRARDGEQPVRGGRRVAEDQ